ncbi:MAG: hypothetical protein ABJM29_14115 [Rhizobiaceae bacterium]
MTENYPAFALNDTTAILAMRISHDDIIVTTKLWSFNRVWGNPAWGNPAWGNPVWGNPSK